MDITIPGLKEQLGLGEALARASVAAGIKPCAGCKKRAAALNKRVIFTPRSEWTKPPDVPEGWTIARMSNSAETVHVLYEYRTVPSAEPSKWIVWDIIDGAYRNSHQACCSGAGEAVVLEEYERRCRP